MTLALFDFDGTITTHETMPIFLRRSVSPLRVFVGSLLLAPLVLGYRRGIVSGTTVRRALVRAGYSGVPVSKVAAAGHDFALNYLPMSCARKQFRASSGIAPRATGLWWFQAGWTFTSPLGARRRAWS